MRQTITRTAVAPLVLAVVALVLAAALPAAAAIDGVEVVSNVTLHARADHITSADGGSIYFWGLTDDPAADARPQYPAPTLILSQGDIVTVTLINHLPEATSLVFPGHELLTSCDGTPGDLTCEAAPAGGSATYTFWAEQPGTYLYHSGTRAALQVEMGLLGAIIVRPNGFDPANPTAYGHPDSAYDREYLFLLSEMDSRIHQMVERGEDLDGNELLGDYFSNYWFINGRTAPDTMSVAGAAWLPTQPYNILPQMHPGERLLMRVACAGRDLHPYHNHGNHADVIARNGRMLSSVPGAGADLRYEVFTFQAVPGETYDGIFTWTGEKMGWDIYGTPADGVPAHDCVDDVDNLTGVATTGPCAPGDCWGDLPGQHDAEPFEYAWEYCPDHGKPIPVHLPENTDLAFGAFWSGSPFMGAAGALPPGEGGLNPNSGYTFMWHSHTEKELTNYDIFPGGMLTMLIVQPPVAAIVE